MKKASGRLEPFNREKLINTLVRVGADEETANEIVSVIERRIWDGIPTSEILDRALTLLHKRYPPASIRYDLKRAVMLLGPSGYPFEDYFASILRAHGYIVEGVRMIIEGRCVTHEVDVVVRYKSERVFVECKYHNRRGIKTDLKGKVPNVGGLYAVGEVASVRVHGANRLASNSLLEGLVFAREAAKDILQNRDIKEIPEFEVSDEVMSFKEDKAKKNLLRRIMWENVSIVRTKEGLNRALEQINALLNENIGKLLKFRLLTAKEIVLSALSRKESVGVHTRLEE